ncbi:hypothetical protein C2E23DRAFT_410496 [Lenzites betulinus]|nr:hypothetical protein C2E23DRAFT_410496 [Lenzites betulinus]
MHSVSIRRPDSVVGSEDSDQPDFRIVVDSPMASRGVRFKSLRRSPRTNSLLMALGTVIKQDAEDGEWEEEESAEQESSSGEGSEEGGASEEYAKPPTPPAEEEEAEGDTSLLFSAGDVDTPAAARPVPILEIDPDAMQLLSEIRSPEDDVPSLLGSYLADTADDTTAFVGDLTLGSTSTSESITSPDDEETTVRFRRALIPEFPAPPTSLPSPRRDSTSSGLLSPIEIAPSPPINLPRHATVSREESFDSGYADGPVQLPRSPPRRENRMSTLSILSSPFGSPSTRMRRYEQMAGPGAATLFSPRFGTFPTHSEQEQEDTNGFTRHGRGSSVDTLDSISDVAPRFGEQPEPSPTDVFVSEVPAFTSPRSPTRHSSIPEGSFLFRTAHSPVYAPIDEGTLRPGEPAFGEDDTMTSLYDQYYTPTIHTQPLLLTSAAHEASPTTLAGSISPTAAPPSEAGPSSRPQSSHLLSGPSSPSRSVSGYHHPQQSSFSPASSSTRAPPPPRLSLRRSSHYAHVFSPPSASGSSVGFAMLEQLRSPAISVTDENMPPLPEDDTVRVSAEGSVRSASSMSSRAEDSNGQLSSRKVPFGFRNSVSDRSQVSARSSSSVASRRVTRVKPPPLVDIGRIDETSRPSAVSVFSPVEPPSATSSAGPGRLRPLRLSMILTPSSSLDSSVPSATHPPSLTTATTATTGKILSTDYYYRANRGAAHTPSSPTVSSEYSLSNSRLVGPNIP